MLQMHVVKSHGVSNRADILLIEKSEIPWISIDCGALQIYITEEIIYGKITDNKSETTDFFHNQLNKSQLRENYIELLELAIKCLGEELKIVVVFV